MEKKIFLLLDKINANYNKNWCLNFRDDELELVINSENLYLIGDRKLIFEILKLQYKNLVLLKKELDYIELIKSFKLGGENGKRNNKFIGENK